MASKFALVIANTEYQDPNFAKLTAPGKDAEEFAQILRDLAGFEVQVLLNEDEGNTSRAIAHFFKKRTPDDLLLIYFSGHGVRSDEGKLFLATKDTDTNILDATSISSDFVTNAMNNSRSQRQVLVLDCCNSGAFVQGHGRKGAEVIGESMGIATAFEGRGFGRIVLTATDATQYAWEGDKIIGNTQKSVFTHFLVEGLGGYADKDGDGRITVDELYDYAYDKVRRATPKQTPSKWAYREQGELVLLENLQPRNVKPMPLSSDLLDLLSHPNPNVRKEGIEKLISLLEEKNLGLIRSAQEKLQEIAETDDSYQLRDKARNAVSAWLAKQADQFEQKGDFGNALQAYSKIKKIAPLFPNVDIKIKELERGVQLRPVSAGREEVRPDLVSAGSAHKKISPQLTMKLIGGIAGALLVLILFAWGGWQILNGGTVATPEFTQTPQPTETQTLKPSETALVQATEIPPTLIVPATLPTGKDGMPLILIPAGEFKMGSNSGDAHERPIHTIYLDAFLIDQTEVTNAMYAACVNSGECDPPRANTSVKQNASINSFYYGNPDFDNHPVIYVSWNNAKTYCESVDRRLPTEAEWEKAASWDEAQGVKRVYPWGNTVDCSYTNYYSDGALCVGDTKPVGSYPTGASFYGVLDMAGNVWEWVADRYDPEYYGESVYSNPRGPASGDFIIIRGGSFLVGGSNGIRSSYREKMSPDIASHNIGFRCAVDAP